VVPLPRQLPWWLKLANPVVKTLLRLGVPIGTQHVLAVPGRKTGRLRSTPVSLLALDGQRYVVSLPWTGWVRNARVAGWGTLTRSRRTERVALREVVGDERARVARAFPVQVPHGVGFFQLPPDPDAFEAAAPELAVFRIEPAPAA
jgi:hypothetical protein